jgi:hypothetical protein
MSITNAAGTGGVRSYPRFLQSGSHTWLTTATIQEFRNHRCWWDWPRTWLRSWVTVMSSRGHSLAQRESGSLHPLMPTPALSCSGSAKHHHVNVSVSTVSKRTVGCMRHVHTVVRPSSPSVSRTFTSSSTNTLYSLNTRSPFSAPAPGHLHSTFCLLEFACSGCLCLLWQAYFTEHNPWGSSRCQNCHPF